MEFLIIAFIASAFFVRNTAQDVIYKRIRGEDPPYVVRRREREAKRAARVPLAKRGPASRYFASLWEDAWEDAQEKRARAHAKKREQRREGWAERDAIDALEDEAWAANRERDKAKAGDDPSTADDAPPEMPAPPVDETPAAAPEDTSPKADQDGATVTQMDDWRNNPAGDSTQEENDLSVNAETTNLSAILAYTTGMANTCQEGVSSTETSIASLASVDVSGPGMNLLAQAQEAVGQAATLYQQAHDEFVRHIQVQDAYNANPDAGNKEYVTQD